MDTPAATLNYMIAGYAVIFGVMAGYITSLVLRWRNARQDLALLEALEQEQGDRFQTD
jgi:hypothetical protein